jgi:uncharacterized BrkB/YihY/UPF0761 family membrane protein
VQESPDPDERQPSPVRHHERVDAGRDDLDQIDELVGNVVEVTAQISDAPVDRVEPSHGVKGYVARQSRRARAVAKGAADWVESRREHNVLIDIAFRLYERDKASAGSVLGSAVAFRLFLFFVPLLLFAVGLAGFLAAHLEAKSLSGAAGVSGTLATQIEAAFSQPGSTRWVATLAGFFGMLGAGRSLTKALLASAALSWQVPLREQKLTVKMIGAVTGLVVALALLAVAVNRIRGHLGLTVASMSLVAVAALYLVAWLVLTSALPRATTDPGALLPGALVFGVALAAMQAVAQLYLPGRFEHASALYGSVGIAIATLGWFFIIGRVIVFTNTLNAVVYERVGSVSQVVFELPVLRALPRRSPRLATYFNLAHRPGASEAPPTSPEPEPSGDGSPEPLGAGQSGDATPADGQSG